MTGTAGNGTAGHGTARETLDALRRHSSPQLALVYGMNGADAVESVGTGARLRLSDGRSALDFGSYAVTLLGQRHPAVVAAVRAELEAMPVSTRVLGNPTTARLVKELADWADPERLTRVWLGLNGSDAVEAALKLIRTATGRSGLLAFTGAYHGMTAGALEASGGAQDVRVTRLPYPQDYRCPFGIGGPRGAELAARWTESLLDDTKSGVPQPAGMILEPVQGEGGVVPAPDGWLRRMRAVTEQRSIPLVVDEVQTGVGRTGAFWAVEHSGVAPDVMVLSKAIGGSLPLAVVVYHEDLDVWPPGAHAGTFRGNQLAMAAGAATLAYVRENGLAERAATLGSRMIDQLRRFSREFACVGEVRGRGLMIGVELVDPEGAAPTSTEFGDDPLFAGAAAPLPAAPQLAAAVRDACLQRGLIVELGGRRSSVVRLLPPLTITDEQAAAIVDRLTDALAAVARARHHQS